MPVSLERLIAEVEPNVITEQLTRECIQVWSDTHGCTFCMQWQHMGLCCWAGALFSTMCSNAQRCHADTHAHMPWPARVGMSSVPHLHNVCMLACAFNHLRTSLCFVYLTHRLLGQTPTLWRRKSATLRSVTSNVLLSLSRTSPRLTASR